MLARPGSDRPASRLTGGEYRQLGLMLLAAAGLRALYHLSAARALPFLHHPIGDARVYLDWAQALARGGTPVTGAFYRAPLYPHLLALVLRSGLGVTGALVLQSLLGLASLLLVYLIARRLAGRVAAIAAFILAALCAPLWFHESKLVGATLTLGCCLLGTYLALLGRWWRWLLAGLCFGAGMLAWPGTALVLLALLGLAFALRQARGRELLLCIAAAALAVMPVTIHNAVNARDFVPVSYNGGFTFYQGNNRLAAGTLAQPPEVFEQPADVDVAGQERFEQAYVSRALGRTPRPSEISGFWLRRAGAWLRSRPGDFLLLLGRKLALAFADYESPADYNLDVEAARVRPLRVAVVRFGLLFALAVAGLAFGLRRRLWPAYALILGTLLVLLVFYVNGRYRLTMLPGLAVLAGAGVAGLADAARPWRRRIGAALAGGGAWLLSAVVLVVPLQRGSRMLAGQAYQDLAGAWLGAGEPTRAESALVWSVAIYETSLDPSIRQERLLLEQARALLAALRQRSGGLEEARAALARADTAAARAGLERAIAAEPDRREAWLLLGSILGAQGRPDSARLVFEQATARFPGDPVLLYNLSVSALKSGDARAALATAEQVLRLVPDHPLARRVAAAARRAVESR